MLEGERNVGGPMKNHEIAIIFSSMGDLLEISGENAFRVNSYRNAARIIDDLNDDVEHLYAAGKLSDIPGIGERTQQKIIEYIQTGKIGSYEELRRKIPPRLPDLLRIPGMGPKTVMHAWKQLGIEDTEGLTKAIGSRKILELPGMGEKKVENIKKGIQFLTRTAGRVALGMVFRIGKTLLEELRKIPGVRQAELSGSLRRWSETIGDIDIVVEAEDGESVLKRFSELNPVQEVLALGDTKASVRITDNIQVDVRVVPAESFGAAWMYFTGSKAHNIRLREIAIEHKLKLNEYGLYSGEKQVAGSTEESVYKKLGLPWIAPELREDRGEIENADHLPKLIEIADIKGDLHMHTEASDGHCRIEEMIEACIQRGYQYMCISDHSGSSKVANGLDRRRMVEQIKKIRHAGEKYKKDIMVFVGSEVDILADGTLDYEDDILKELDFPIASIHSGLNQPAEKITSRVLHAMDNPYIRAIGHLTGRIIGQREGSAADVSAVIHHAAETGTWMELNSSWLRLDINDVQCRQAKEAGAKIVINTDSHDTQQLDQIQFGVHTARRGWIEAKDVVNTYDKDTIVQLLHQPKTAFEKAGR